MPQFRQGELLHSHYMAMIYHMNPYPEGLEIYNDPFLVIIAIVCLNHAP